MLGGLARAGDVRGRDGRNALIDLACAGRRSRTDIPAPAGPRAPDRTPRAGSGARRRSCPGAGARSSDDLTIVLVQSRAQHHRDVVLVEASPTPARISEKYEWWISGSVTPTSPLSHSGQRAGASRCSRARVTTRSTFSRTALGDLGAAVDHARDGRRLRRRRDSRRRESSARPVAPVACRSPSVVKVSRAERNGRIAIIFHETVSENFCLTRQKRFS